MFYYIIAFVIICLDQLTKWLIVKHMMLGDSIPVIDGFFYITSHRNSGAAWGILQGQMWFFYVITLVVIAGIVYYLQKHGQKDKLLGVALALMLGGAIGNFIDRIFRQEVVDFAHFVFGDYHYPIFNIADSSLCVGVILLFIQMLLDGKKNKESTT
ncbi:signal peptidase II [Bacillus altitudinis MN12]|uniref:Lipoprotein signal peptidase n=4 Tax=Bacillus TaxID=1386 RepID=A0ABV1S6Y4_BACAB|nr:MULTISPECIES: signal peptidase II [Bacillus]AMM88862.1 peptidase A8 [Bacillus pumilus]KML18002.1 peptidase A8 [Bacillus stratosphericus]KQL47479.1 signal peptidase II [Bacillus sp. FJAT-21955]MBR0581759.1 signal peptidase II [Bacillus altitudinis MN12]MBR0594451.1 signal peptidase II [Bacillus altitudinis C16B11]MBR0627912.1 signal peptidase II [Bacillus altitudinis S70-5-12]MBR0630408.1 signal peptidase II [Bacillus altitudinis C101]MBU4618934.1 signal peptidase II [Bacillus sp. GG161]